MVRTTSCTQCGKPTRMLGTKLCDGCWERNRRAEWASRQEMSTEKAVNKSSNDDLIAAILEEMTASCTLTWRERAACILSAIESRICPQTKPGIIKSPGQFLYERFSSHSPKWNELSQSTRDNWEQDAEALVEHVRPQIAAKMQAIVLYEAAERVRPKEKPNMQNQYEVGLFDGKSFAMNRILEMRAHRCALPLPTGD